MSKWVRERRGVEWCERVVETHSERKWKKFSAEFIFPCKWFSLFECKSLGKLKTYDATTMVSGWEWMRNATSAFIVTIFLPFTKWTQVSRSPFALNVDKINREFSARILSTKKFWKNLISLKNHPKSYHSGIHYVSKITHKSDLIKKLHLLFLFVFLLSLYDSCLTTPLSPPNLLLLQINVLRCVCCGWTRKIFLAFFVEPEKFWDCGNYFYLIFALFCLCRLACLLLGVQKKLKKFFVLFILLMAPFYCGQWVVDEMRLFVLNNIGKINWINFAKCRYFAVMILN